MKVLDLFSGLKGWSTPFAERGHQTFCVELNPKFAADFRDVLLFDPAKDLPWKPDIILASPPCTAFTVMAIGKNWTKDHQPKTQSALLGLKLMRRTLELIKLIDPKYFIIQYGEDRTKPTDLWGKFPPGLVLAEPCKNGMPCHKAAPRGSTTGTQGMDSAESARIPYALALAVCKAAELGLDMED